MFLSVFTEFLINQNKSVAVSSNERETVVDIIIQISNYKMRAIFVRDIFV